MKLWEGKMDVVRIKFIRNFLRQVVNQVGVVKSMLLLGSATHTQL